MFGKLKKLQAFEFPYNVFSITTNAASPADIIHYQVFSPLPIPLHSLFPFLLPAVFYCLTSILTVSLKPSSPSLHLPLFFYDTHTHPLSFFSLLMLSFSCNSFSSISLLSWARVTVFICSSCRFLWKHLYTITYMQSTNNNQSYKLPTLSD